VVVKGDSIKGTQLLTTGGIYRRNLWIVKAPFIKHSEKIAMKGSISGVRTLLPKRWQNLSPVGDRVLFLLDDPLLGKTKLMVEPIVRSSRISLSEIGRPKGIWDIIPHFSFCISPEATRLLENYGTIIT
jgi:hypothetical protein